MAGGRLYFIKEERNAALAAAAEAPREVPTFCGVLHTTGCRISDVLVLTVDCVDLAGQVIVVESRKKHRRGGYRAAGAA